MNTIELNENYKSNIVAELTNTLTETSLPSEQKDLAKYETSMNWVTQLL